MLAHPILSQKKYARVVALFAKTQGITTAEALDFFYHSYTYECMSQGISDMHCRSDLCLVEELQDEYAAVHH